MQRPAAEALVRAHDWLKQRGYGLLIHETYRPWHVTKMFWDATPESMKHFVANAAEGSRSISTNGGTSTTKTGATIGSRIKRSKKFWATSRA